MGRAFTINGVEFHIHPAEDGHNEPHVHTKYSGEEMVVSLITFKVLAGNISNRSKRRVALEETWKHRGELSAIWRGYHA